MLDRKIRIHFNFHLSIFYNDRLRRIIRGLSMCFFNQRHTTMVLCLFSNRACGLKVMVQLLYHLCLWFLWCLNKSERIIQIKYCGKLRYLTKSASQNFESVISCTAPISFDHCLLTIVTRASLGSEQVMRLCMIVYGINRSEMK